MKGNSLRGCLRISTWSPTRELAMQVNEHIRQFATHTDLRFLAVYGGVGIKPQIELWKIDILVATPGRLMDLYLGILWG